MGDENPIRTLEYYTKHSHKGNTSTIELPVGNKVVPFRSDNIRLVQNRCSFHGLRSMDPNQHLNDFLKLVDSFDLDGENKERMRLHLFQFSLRDQASNWLEQLPAGSITTWEDLTTHFLAQFFLPRRTAKLRNDILMFQQHHGESLFEAWTHFKDLLQKVPHHDIDCGSKELETKNGCDNKTKNKPIKKDEKEKVVKASSSQPVEYYLKHRINEKLLEGLVDNHKFNDSLSRVRVGKIKGKTYNLSTRGPVYEAILRKKITRKEDIEGNFKLPCNIGGLKHMNALVDQGSDVNAMPLSTYMKLSNERPTKTDIRLSLASHSYIYPLGIAEDLLVEVAEHVYPMDFVILDIKENEKRPFILGIPFLTMAKVVIKFDKGTITLRSRKSKISFHRFNTPKLTRSGTNHLGVKSYTIT
nr:zinc finger, CCHC-type [Tanacetum cinerariifolium]